MQRKYNTDNQLSFVYILGRSSFLSTIKSLLFSIFTMGKKITIVGLMKHAF